MDRELGEGQEGYVALAAHAFYLEAGGQVSDQGRPFGADGSEATVQRMVRYAPGRPGCIVQVTRGRVPPRSDRVGGGAGRAARCDAPQSHRHPPAARGAAAGARLAREAGRLARRARSAALRLRALRGRFRARADPRDRTDRQRADPPQHRGADGGPLDGERSRPARWRCSARNTAIASASCRCPASAGAVRRHARQGDRRHRLSSSITEESGVAAGVRRIEAWTGARPSSAQQQRAAIECGASAAQVPAEQAAEAAVQRLQAELKRARATPSS